VDKFLVAGMHNWLTPLLVGMGLTTLLRGGLTWLREYYLLRLETKLSVASSSQFFWHVLRLPIQFFTQRYAGEISSRVGLNDQVAQLLVFSQDHADPEHVPAGFPFKLQSLGGGEVTTVSIEPLDDTVESLSEQLLSIDGLDVVLLDRS